MSITEPDYLRLWHELATRAHGHFGARFDQKERAREYDAASKRRNVGRPDFLFQFVKRDLRPQDTVIDIGAGTGRWTVPLATVTDRVTAVEPAAAMAEVLRANAEEAGVSGKITVVPATWEAAEVAVHDVVTCFHAIYMSADFAAFVRKMEAHARRSCYLGLRHFPADGVIQELSARIYGVRHDSPNFIVGYNALYQMGIYANVLIEDFQPVWTDESLEAAFARAKRHLFLTDGTHDDLVRSTLDRRLVLRGGVYQWPDAMSTALVWWNVTGKPGDQSAAR